MFQSGFTFMVNWLMRKSESESKHYHFAEIQPQEDLNPKWPVLPQCKSAPLHETIYAKHDIMNLTLKVLNFWNLLVTVA